MKLTAKVRDVLVICRHQEALWRVSVAMRWAMEVEAGFYGCGGWTISSLNQFLAHARPSWDGWQICRDLVT